VTDNYLNGIDYAIIALYLGAIVTLGIHLKRRASTSLEQYLVGERSMSWWILGISGVMDFWDVAGTMIIVSFLYLLGPRGLLIEFRGGAVLVLAVTMLWTGKWHRRSGCLTGAEWMIYRFGDGAAGRIAQLARAVAGIVVTVGMIAYLVKGIGLFLSTFVPFAPAQCAFVLVASATVYTMFSGFRGVVIIHLLQMGIVVAAALTIVVLGVQQSSNVASLAELAQRVTGNPDWTAAAPTIHAVVPVGYEPYRSLALFATLYLLRNVLFGMGAGDDPKYFAARSDADCGKLTFLWICLISLRWPMMIGLAMLGLGVVSQEFPDGETVRQAAEIVRSHVAPSDQDWSGVTSQIANHPEAFPADLAVQLKQLLGDQWRTKLPLVGARGTINPERVMPAVLLLTIPPGFRALLVVSLIAAAMAGFGAWINQAAGFFVHDIYQKHCRPRASVPEMIFVTWAFIGALAAAGFLFAYSVPSINDIWAWIVMGLGSGMMMPQLLPLYWQRFNGVGYTAGTLAGVVAAVALRIVAPTLDERWSFLQTENWMLPLLGAVGLVAAIAGTFASAPTPTAVLRRFYNSTLPFGFWKPYAQELSASLQKRVAEEHRRDLSALPLALLFQVMIFLTPMLAVMRSWSSFGVCLLITTGSLGLLYLIWLRHLEESDRIVADVQAFLAQPMSGHEPLLVVERASAASGSTTLPTTNPSTSS
jgi:SSS family solute:Na+ symporter